MIDMEGGNSPIFYPNSPVSLVWRFFVTSNHIPLRTTRLSIYIPLPSSHISCDEDHRCLTHRFLPQPGPPISFQKYNFKPPTIHRIYDLG